EEDVEIASGRAPFAAGQWHTIALRMEGDRLDAVLAGQVVGSVRDSRHTIGLVGLRVNGWQPGQFDNVSIAPTGPAPQFVPQEEMSIVATSEHDEFYRGDVFNDGYLVDG